MSNHEIDIDSSPNCRNFRNRTKKMSIPTEEKNGYGKNFLDMTPEEIKKEIQEIEGKPRWSRKYKCPRCGKFPLEIYNFVNPDGSFVCNVYVCDRHQDTPSFFTKEECDKI